MKTIKLLFCSSLLVLSSSLLYGQSWDWGAAGYGSIKSNDNGSSVATDKYGNAYCAGQYETSITFGSTTLTGSSANAYLVKYNSTGNLIWATQATDVSGGQGYGIGVTTDNTGNIYTCGEFGRTVDFGSYALNTSPGYESSYLAKYSPAGNVLWAKQGVLSSTNSAGRGNAVTTDKYGSVITTGYFEDSITFGGNTLYTNGLGVFVAKYDSSGNVVWAKESTMPSSICYGYATSIATDNSGNICVSGYFYTAIFFGSYQLLSLNSYSPFLVKYDQNGNVLWATQGNNSTNSSSIYDYANAVVADGDNNVYITGYFEDSLAFGAQVLNSPSQYSVFFAKYDSTGNLLWAEQSSQGWEGTGLAVDAANHIYMIGRNSISDSKIVFGSYTLNVIPWASANTFLIKFDQAGTAICGSSLENLGEGNLGVACDPSGIYIYAAGTFANDSIKCDKDTLFSGTGGSNVFVGRWLNCNGEEGIPPIQSSNPSITLFPNPNNGTFTLQIVGAQNFVPSTVEIYNVLGERVYSSALPQTPKGALIAVDIGNQPNGIYLYRVINEDGTMLGQGKIVVEK